jgi:cytochrome P450
VFKPELQFGYGPRFCIGAALAKNQLYVTMCELMKRFPNVELMEEPKRDASNHNAIMFESLMLKTNI